MKRNNDLTEINIVGEQRYKLLNLLLKEEYECEDIVDKNDTIILFTHRRSIKYIISASKALNCEVIYENGFNNDTYIKHALKHSGLIMGIILSAILCYFFSGLIFRIKIDNESEQVKADIISVFNENGLHIGSNKDDFDYIKLERELKSKVNGISWAGISVQGSTIVVDTIDNIPAPESDNKRMPCNVVALYDCVIEKAEVFNGELKVNSGSAAKAGDIIISGEKKTVVKTGKDDKETELTQYIRADGRVYGTFYKTVKYYFPYEETVNTPTGKKDNVKYLNIFDTDIPLFINKRSGTYTYNATRKPLTAFGLELPLAVTEVEYSEYVEALNTYTDEMIDKKIEKSIENYEQGILTSFEIKNVKKDITRSEEGVTAKLEYTLYGEIGEQVDIYLNKE